MKKGGLTAKNVEVKLRELSGNFAAVGRAFGVTRIAVWRFVHARPSLLAIADECREAMKDEAESSLYKAVRDGEAWAVCFYLKTQAKDRGYVERTETKTVTDEQIERDIAELLRNGQAAAPAAPRRTEEPGASEPAAG